MYIAANPTPVRRADPSHNHAPQHHMRDCCGCAAAFTNGTFGAAFVSSDGTWLDDPVAVLRATSGGKPMSALLRLSNPRYDAANSILTLEARVTLFSQKVGAFCC